MKCLFLVGPELQPCPNDTDDRYKLMLNSEFVLDVPLCTDHCPQKIEDRTGEHWMLLNK